MDKHDILRQIEIVSNLLDGAAADDFWRPDLTVAAAKLRALRRQIPRAIDVPREVSDLLADVARLRRRWGQLYFGDPETQSEHDEPAPSLHAGRNREPWTIEEERRFVASLDETAIRLFSIFGRVRNESRVDGRWCIRSGAMTYDAASLREKYKSALTAGSIASDWMWTLAEDSVLLVAGGGVQITQLSSLAEEIGPAVHDLFGNQEPDLIMWQVFGRLMSRGLLHAGTTAHSGSHPTRLGVFSLTEAGLGRASEAFVVWWPFSPEGGWTAQPRAESRSKSAPQTTCEDD